MNKELLISFIKSELNNRINELRKDIESLRESRNNDTKSSAGDKYETGREMIQMELNKLEQSLLQKTNELNEFDSIDFNGENIMVKKGSLVITNEGLYFLAIGIGKIIVESTIVYVLSIESPLGKVLINKETNEDFQFQNRTIGIKKIV